MRGRAFRGSPASFALSQPLIAPRHLQENGAPLGFDLRTGKVIVFYPWSLPTHSTTFQIEGEKGSGKSTFMKTLIPRALGLQARDAYGNPTKARARFNSRKSEEGVSEFLPVAEAMYSPIYDLANNGSINLLGLFQDEAEIIEVSLNLMQEVNSGLIGEKATLATMVGVRKMLEQFDSANTVFLEATLRTLTLSDYREYLERNLLNVFSKIVTEKQENLPAVQHQLQISLEDMRIDESYLDAQVSAANLLLQLTTGKFGNAFGGTNDLYNVLTQPLVTLNWENLPEAASTVLEAVLMKAQGGAIVRRAGRRDLSRIIPHYNMSDEEAGAMKSLMHARFAADYQNKSRAFPQADFRSIQYYVQVTQAGDAGSEIRGLAQEIELGVGCRIIFRQPNDNDFLQRFARLGMSDTDIELLPTLDVGQAFLWVRDRPPILFQHVLLSTEEGLVDTNAQRRHMNDTIPLDQNDEFRRRMDYLGGSKNVIDPFAEYQG